LVLFLPVPNSKGDERLSIELTPQVRQQLRALQDAWRTWSQAFFKDDRKAADASLEQILAIGRFLELPRLSDLSVAAATCAVQAAQEGDTERAKWGLEVSHLFDSGRPETDFAGARIARLEGNLVGALIASLRGYRLLMKLPIERQVMWYNVGVWLAYLLILSGCAFVILQMATKGGSVFYDLVHLISPPLPPLAADLLVVAVLIWPILLPSGLVWLTFYWSVLLWSYGSVSERVVFILLWAFLGAVPTMLSFQQRSVQLALMPPSRLMANLEADRLYGEIFEDLGVMRLLWSDSLTVREITADLHRRFGQWDEARAIYRSLTENPEVAPGDKVAAYNNIGVYYLRNQDAVTALTYLKSAEETGVDAAETFYNISQAYSLLFDFSKSNDALTEARRISEKGVEVWTEAGRGSELTGVAIDGGLRRAGALRRELRSLWRSDSSTGWLVLWRRHSSFSVGLAALVLAITLHLVRLQVGNRSKRLNEPENESRLLRILVPGWTSALAGHGGRALLALLLVVGALLLPLVRNLGYRVPLAWDAGLLLPTALSLFFLALIFLGRTLIDLAVES
jgi:tetratricopeptide (TPR) repeat protein